MIVEKTVKVVASPVIALLSLPRAPWGLYSQDCRYIERGLVQFWIWRLFTFFVLRLPSFAHFVKSESGKILYGFFYQVANYASSLASLATNAGLCGKYPDRKSKRTFSVVSFMEHGTFDGIDAKAHSGLKNCMQVVNSM